MLGDFVAVALFVARSLFLKLWTEIRRRNDFHPLRFLYSCLEIGKFCMRLRVTIPREGILMGRVFFCTLVCVNVAFGCRLYSEVSCEMKITLLKRCCVTEVNFVNFVTLFELSALTDMLLKLTLFRFGW